jgi:hypothetical protein
VELAPPPEDEPEEAPEDDPVEPDEEPDEPDEPPDAPPEPPLDEAPWPDDPPARTPDEEPEPGDPLEEPVVSAVGHCVAVPSPHAARRHDDATATSHDSDRAGPDCSKSDDMCANLSAPRPLLGERPRSQQQVCRRAAAPDGGARYRQFAVCSWHRARRSALRDRATDAAAETGVTVPLTVTRPGRHARSEDEMGDTEWDIAGACQETRRPE